MVQSKEWNWAVANHDIWDRPSEDVYYYLDRWNSKGFKHFLDLGCGLGRHSLLFANQGFITHSLDLSEYALCRLKEHAEQMGVEILTEHGDLHELPYASEKFDCLLAYHVISHTDTAGIKRVLSEIERVLKPGGECLITLCSKNSPSFTKESNVVVDDHTIIKMEEPEVGVPHYYCELDDVKALMSHFELLKVRHIEDIFENTSSWHYFIHGKKN